MGSKNASTPQIPDPSYVSQQQSQSNLNTAISQARLNNVNQVTPMGSLTYDETGGKYDYAGNWVPQFTATTKLSPEQQKLYETQARVTQGAYDLADQYTGRIGAATAQPFNYEGLPNAPVYNEEYRQKQYDNILQRAQPQMDRDRAQLEQRLADQGVTMQDPGYRTAMDQYGRTVNDFRLGADTQAGNAAAQQYGLEGQTRDRAIAERANLRSQPINEVAALLGTGSGVQGPQFVNTPQSNIAPTDVSGNYWNAYQSQVQQQQLQQQQQNAMMGGLFGLGSTGLGAWGMAGFPGLGGGAAAGAHSLGGLMAFPAIASDIRVKEHIRPIGQTYDGQNLYSFRYIGDPTPRIGLMAQEVEQRDPAAVVEIDGVKHVDYDRALAPARRSDRYGFAG